MRQTLLHQRTFICSILIVGSVFAEEPRQHFVEPQSIDIREILNDPAAPGSSETLREINAILARQATRTPTDEARADREGKWSPFLFDDVLGSWFTAQNVPCTATLLDNIGRDTMEVCEAAKKLWSRPRPPLQDRRIHPSVGLPTSSSYPSGHGAYGMVVATVLAELAPDLKEQLMQRGKQIGDDRILGGVHFPSDVDAGRALAPVILARLYANPEFRAALEKSEVEFRSARAQRR